jgi:rhodanese-related sulfurtransferase
VAHLGKDVVVVVLGGVVFGLVANALSPRGLSLTRDYFNGGVAVAPRTASVPARATAVAEAKTDAAGAVAHTKHGLPVASHDEVVAWFHDPRTSEQRILFVDARDDDRYAAGHIPGAYPFDHYHPERTLANILGLSQLAEKIVVYCTGGECEDSELAVQDLIALGIPAEKLVIYGGGITEWTKRELPVRKGASP